MSLYSPLTEPAQQPGRLNRRTVFRTLAVGLLGATAVALGVVCFAMTTGTGSHGAPAPSQGKLMIRSAIPSSYAVDHITPYKSQEKRGTCWIFSTVGILENAYRAQGIREGYLQPNEYVSFSEQAFGSVMMDLCAQEHSQCVIAGDRVAWGKTASGGETALLAYFGKKLSDRLIPHAVCPYTPNDDGHDQDCDGLPEAILNNPVSFKINSWDTYYTVEGIKQALARNGRAMGISTPTMKTVHYIPCVGELAKSEKCAKNSNQECQTFCPAGARFYPSVCCIEEETSMYNLDGEFYSQGGSMKASGGHAMLIVGYSDSYTTRNGDRGGFIIRNSWTDGLGEAGGRGHHSVKHFLQEISEIEERVICPNAYSPWSWYVCDDRYPCNHAYNVEGAQQAHQENELKCIDENECDTSLSSIYYLKSIDEFMESGLHTVCFTKYSNGEPQQDGDFCLSPRMLSTVAAVIRPANEAIPKNSMDECGYYFMPYSLAEMIKARFGMFFVNDFDITFDSASYIANKKNANHNYDLVQSSTKLQEEHTFDGPFPHKIVNIH